MGILDKALDIGSEIKDTVFDFSGDTRGSLAAQKLINEGHLVVNNKRDQIETSMSFLADEKKKLDANNFSSSEVREALLYHEIQKEKKILEGSNRVYDPVKIRENLEGPGKFDELIYNPHMAKREKAVEFKLPSGMSYTSDNIEDAIIKHTAPQKRLFNRLAKEMYNSYGWDKDLANVLGVGKNRDLTMTKIGDYNFLTQQEDSPIKQAFIKKITEELESGKGRYNDIDSKELRDKYKTFTSNLSYTADENMGNVNMGDMRENSDTAKYVKTFFDGSMEEEFSEKTAFVLNQDTDTVADDIPIKYGELFKSSNLTNKTEFQEDLNVTSAFISNIFNNAKLVPKGGVLNTKQITEMAVGVLFGMGNLNFDKTNKYMFITDIEATYNKMTSKQLTDLFNMLPTMLNAFAETEQLSDAEIERINEQIVIAKSQERTIELAQDVNHPINVANNIVNTMKFNSIEERRKYIEQQLPMFADKYTNEDIEFSIQIMETADIGEKATETLLRPIQENEDTEPVEIVNVFDIATDQEKSKFVGSEENRYNDAIKRALRFSSKLESKDFQDSAKPTEIEMITKRLEKSEEEINSIIEKRGTSFFIDPVPVIKESLLVSDKDKLKDFTIPNLKRSLNNKNLSKKRKRKLEKELEDAENKLKELE